MASFRPAILLALFLPALAARASAQSDSAVFAVLRGADTVAIEHFTRDTVNLSGRLELPPKAHQRTVYHAVLLPDGTTPLLELGVWQGEDAEGTHARQTTRIIFKDDSVSVDDANSRGMVTMVLPTTRGAVPYLNLSFAFLEQATRRARAFPGDSLAVPFFSLGGGQTLAGEVVKLSGDSTAVRIGKVEFRLATDAAGRILGGGIPAQDLRVVRAQ